MTDTTGTGSDTGASDTMTDTSGTGSDTGASDTMTDTTGTGSDTGASDTMTDTSGTGSDTGASDTMTDTSGTGSDTGASDTMTDTSGTGADAGATGAMTDTAGASGTMTDTADTAGTGAAGGAGATAMAGGPTAHAEMMTTDGTVVGMAHFTATEDGGVMVQVDVAGVAGAAAGEHGIHVHMVGACDPPDFMSAGEHYNPTAMKHGLENPDGPHAGDLPNITFDDAGNGTFNAATATFALGEGENSLMDADGSALIIHANPDDQVTDPSGNSGARLVCGVITADAAAQ
jgi:Cu-Zn family superoxide dismutase